MNAQGWAVALIVFLLTGEPVREGMSKETVHIRVVDSKSGKHLEGVDVHADPRYPDWGDPPAAQHVVTGGDGRAAVEREKRGFWTWMFRKKGYLVAILDGKDVKEGTTVRLTAARPHRGRVVTFGDAKPIASARIHQWFEGWGLESIDRMIETAGDGTFEVPGLPAGKTVMFGVAAEGYASVIVRCPPDRRESPLVVVLGEGGTVTGRVLDAKGRPLAGADVFLAEKGGDDPLRKARHVGDLYKWQVAALRNHATSGPDGGYLFAGVPTRSPHVIHARSNDEREGRTGAVTLKLPGDLLAAEVRVRHLARITLRLFDAGTEKEIDGLGYDATIDRRHGDGRRDQDASYDSKSKRHYFADVRPGTHVVYLSPKRHVKKRVTVTVRPGEDRELRVLVDRGTFLRGRIVNPQGNPLSAHVRLYWMDAGEEEYRSGMAAKDGTFELRGIPEADARFVAWPDGGGEGEWKVTTGKDVGDLVVQPAPRVVARLIGAGPGDPGKGGVVYGSGGGTCAWFGFGEDGTHVFEDVLPDRDFAVYLGVRGRAPFVKHGLRVKPGQTLDLGAVRLPEPVTVRGTVVDATGKPVGFARVRVVEGWQESPATTGPDGGFALAEMPPGRSLLVVEVRKSPRAYAPVDAKPGMEPITIILRAPGTILATVREADGSPVTRFPFNLFARHPDGTRDWNRRVIVRTDGRGEIRATALPDRWYLEPHPNRRRHLTEPCRPLNVTSGNETRVTLTLR